MTEEQFFDFMNCMDEIDDYKTKIRKDFYILKEREEGKSQRVVFKDLNKNLPVDDIKKGNINNIDIDTAIIQVDGGFYPEIIEDIEYPYYYFMCKKYDCIDFIKSNYEKDEKTSGGIRITGGFNLRKEVIKDSDIFRVEFLSNRLFVISERLKKRFEENNIEGIKYTHTNNFVSKP